MEVQRLLHGSKAVLQLSDGILARGVWNKHFVLPVGDEAYLTQQFSDRTHGMRHSPSAEQQNDCQPHYYEADDDVHQLMISAQNIPLGTYQCETPRGTGNRPIAHQAGASVEHHTHLSLVTCRHVVSQRDLVGIFTRVRITEYRLLVKHRRVWMNEIVAIVSYQHEPGVRIRLADTVDGCREVVEREVCRDDAHHPPVAQPQRLAIRCYALGGV